MTIKLNPVKSSNLAAAGYDPASQTLRVQFSNGATWNYHGVSQADHDALLKAESIGSHFAKHVRNKFKATQHQESRQ